MDPPYQPPSLWPSERTNPARESEENDHENWQNNAPPTEPYHPPERYQSTYQNPPQSTQTHEYHSQGTHAYLNPHVDSHQGQASYQSTSQIFPINPMQIQHLQSPFQKGLDWGVATSIPPLHQETGNYRENDELPHEQVPTDGMPWVSTAPYVLPDELIRKPDGGSVIEPDSVYHSENGRLYHGYKEGKYFLPNDPAEQDRLDLQHAMFMGAMDQKLTLVPFTKPPARVMDVATGTGIWAMEFAEQNQTSHVIGTDLSKIQPERNLPNCEFLKEDSEEEWLYGQKFDYIHFRMTLSCFQQPDLVMKHAIDNLVPGGWIEFQEIRMKLSSPDGSHKGTALELWTETWTRGLEAKGRPRNIATQNKHRLIEAGMVSVVERVFDVPIGQWSRDPKYTETAKYGTLNVHSGARGIIWEVATGLGWTPEEIETLVKNVQADCVDKELKTYFTIYVVYGRKPFPGELRAPWAERRYPTAQTS